MKNLFGKKKQDSKTQNALDPIKTIVELTTKIDQLEEKIRFIETKQKHLNEQAKTKLKAGDKNGARQALAKKKKYFEQIKQFEGTMMFLEEQKMMLESAVSMKEYFEAIKNANKCLQSTQKGMDVEDITIMKEEMEEFKYIQKEIGDIFSEYATQEDSEVEDELDKLAAALEKEELPTASEQIIVEKPREEKAKVIDIPNKTKKDEKQLEDFLINS